MEQVMHTVEYVGSAVVAAAGVILWAYNTFQSKRDSERELQVLETRFIAVKEDMTRAEANFQEKVDTLKEDVKSVALDVRSLRTEVREELGHVRSDLHGIIVSNVGISKDMQYIKARLEPRP